MWSCGKGVQRQGRAFSKSSLHGLLTNVQYIGKIGLKGEVFDGEHEAIISPSLWKKVQAQMEANGSRGLSSSRNKTGALLRGILYAEPDGVPMTELMWQIDVSSTENLNEQALVGALADFDDIWDALRSEEREKLIQLLVRRVGYNAESGEVQIQFHASGLNDFILSQAS